MSRGSEKPARSRQGGNDRRIRRGKSKVHNEMFGKQYEISRGWHAALRFASTMLCPSYGMGLLENLELVTFEALERWQ